MLRSIKGKIIVVFSLLIIVSGILIGFTSYQSSKALVEIGRASCRERVSTSV